MASQSDTPPVIPSGNPIPPPRSSAPIDAPPNPGGSSDARNVTAPPSRNKKEPRAFVQPSAATINSAPPLLLGVSNLPFYTQQHLETNTFLPSALVMFALLAELDANMANTYRFLQSAPGWIPLVSQAYIGILFIVHVFRVSRESNTITAEQFQFLQWFESVYDFRTLMIPGPLVPIFQSLAFTSGPFEWIGNVSPNIQDTFKPVLNESYTSRNGGSLYLPNIPLIIDQIQWFLESMNITNDNELYISSHFYSNLFGVPATATSFGRHALMSPNARFNVAVSPQQYRAFKAQRTSFRFPPRLATTNSQTYMTWFEALRFRPLNMQANTSQWFSTMSATMQRYCQFINGSVPLAAVSLTGLGAASISWKYQESTALREPPTFVDADTVTSQHSTITRYPAHFEYTPLSSLSAIGTHFDPELEELAEQFSAATQVNVDFSSSSGSAPVPTDAQRRAGTAWTLPIVRESPIINVLPTHAPLIMTHYHTDTRSSAS